ncbi:MAG TPA: hypothetical protein VMF55_12930 [Solirubrobacterales bacterium]|nr:hypothetical protein [Solirubrobacterales bacterium]
MRTAVAVTTTVLAALLLAAPAAAEWSAPELISVSPREQSDGVTSSVLSADGRYLVFAGSIDGRKGILRRDLRTGAIEPVAAGSAYVRAPIQSSSGPAVSADGRYVSFTTSAALDPADDRNEAPDVYVRDMDLPVPGEGAPCAASGPCAYTLASAVDGGAEGLAYAETGGAGSGRQAISADGGRVAFLVRPRSNVAPGPGQPAQVAVRDLATQRTLLVSSTRDPSTGQMTGEPVPGGAMGRGLGVYTPGFPALSADGTTVAWSAINVAAQVATVAGDPAIRNVEGYNEVLWRRIGEGPSAPTRRVIGAADPEAPGCPPGGSFTDPACKGPYEFSEGNENVGYSGGWSQNGGSEPSLSADGWTVALTGAPNSGLTHSADLFVVDMHPGRARRDAVRRLSLGMATGYGPEFESLPPLLEPTLSPDAGRIAFTTARREWRLSNPTVATPPPPQALGLEVWLVDLGDDTLRRLSVPVDGGAATGGGAGFGSGGADSPSFADGGRMLSFDDTASNLVAVDMNEATDAFLVRDTTLPGGSPGQVSISPPPAPRAVKPGWRLAVHAVSRPDGTVRIVADCPGAGRLRAAVAALMPRRRRVAVGLSRVRAAGLNRLELRPGASFRRLARRRGGLEGTATVTFAARGHAKLRERLAVRFRVHAKARR